MSRLPLVLALGAFVVAGFSNAVSAEQSSENPDGQDQPWAHHSIDQSSRGADGVRLADANGDGLPDITTGWEEGGIIRIYLNPGPGDATKPWPAVTIGKVKSPEDAVFVDLDNDGALDVVSCCEGREQQVFVHWAPRDRSKYLAPDAWETSSFPALRGRQMYMFCLPLQVDGERGVDLVIGSKGKGAQIGWLEAPSNPRDLAAWRWHPLYQAGWTMSLVAADIDHDGDTDILASDRRGKNRGCLWLENPGPKQSPTSDWRTHRIGPTGEEVMFLDYVDVDGDKHPDVVTPTFDGKLFVHLRTQAQPAAWKTAPLPYPQRADTGKAVRIADIDLDGKPDLVLTSQGPSGKSGAVWMSFPKGLLDPACTTHEISGPAGRKGLKPDVIELIDLDADGDLDLLTTEERTGLGVVWYENPIRR